MNTSALGKNAGTHATYKMKSFYMGKASLLSGIGSKSEQEKLQRRQKADDTVSFWEGRKENLKNMKCNSLEDIARKLDMFHTYEDEIAAAKAAYNREQMFHVLDEAEEIGKKIAENVEKTEPKTPEERKEDMVEEALGIEDSGGMLEEVLDEAEEALEGLQETLPEAVEEVPVGETPAGLSPKEAWQYDMRSLQGEAPKALYRQLDIRV